MGGERGFGWESVGWSSCSGPEREEREVADQLGGGLGVEDAIVSLERGKC